MRVTKNLILKEFLWLAASIGLTILSALLSGISFTNNVIDLHFYDTYFVISSWLILIPLFLFFTFLIYLIKEKRKSFIRMIPNWIIIILGVALNIFLGIQIRLLSTMMLMSSTLYPSLSGLGNSEVGEITTNPTINLIVNVLIGMQVIITAMLIYVAYFWGKSKRTDHLHYYQTLHSID